MGHGAHQKVPEIQGVDSQYAMTSIEQAVPAVEVIGDAEKVQDIFTAVHAGYAQALKY